MEARRHLNIPPAFRLRNIGWIEGLLLFVFDVNGNVVIIALPVGAGFFCDGRAANVRFCFDFNRHRPLVVHLSPIVKLLVTYC